MAAIWKDGKKFPSLEFWGLCTRVLSGYPSNFPENFSFYILFKLNPNAPGLITWKQLSGFLWNFQDASNMTQGTMRNILGMFRLTHCTQDFFLFIFAENACLLATLRKKGEQIFMKFSGQVGYTFLLGVYCKASRFASYLGFFYGNLPSLTLSLMIHPYTFAASLAGFIPLSFPHFLIIPLPL